MSGTISQNKKAAKTLRLHDFYSHVVVSLLFCLMLLPIEPDFKVCVLWLLFGQLIILIRCTIKVRKSVKPLVAFLILVLYQPSPFSSDFGIRQSTIIAYAIQCAKVTNYYRYRKNWAELFYAKIAEKFMIKQKAIWKSHKEISISLILLCFKALINS